MVFALPEERPDSLTHETQHPREVTAPRVTAETNSVAPACRGQTDEGSGDRGVTEHVAESHSTFHPLTRIRCATPACNTSMNRALLLFNLTPELGIGKL